MTHTTSFGYWVRRRRKALDLTQAELAQRVGCVVNTIKRIETDTRRPSKEMAERLANCLAIPTDERSTFLQAARAEQPIDLLALATQPLDQASREQPASSTAIPTQAAPAPAFQVPYPQSTLFVGRDAELERLAALLDSNETIAVVPAIAGAGGIGKTMLAAEFTHRYRERFPSGVFWLNMEDPEGVASQIAACAGPGGLQLPGYTSWSFEQQIAATRAAWQQSDHRLLIFDNLEDPALLRWRPSGGGSRVLITTRRATWTVRSGVQAVPLDMLARPDSLRLLLTPRYSSILPDDPHANAICEALGDLPLALALASAYLEHYPSLGLEDYASQISTNLVSDTSLNAVLEEGLPTAHATSIVATFTLSYHQLQTDDPIDALARTLLYRAAYCAPVAIPHALLAYTDLAKQEALVYQRNVDAALHRLLAVGMLSDLGTAGVRLHRLLAAFARSVTPDPDQEQQWVTHTLAALLHEINEAGYPQAGQPYLEHARQIVSAAIDNTTQASLLNNLGALLDSMGELAAARPYLERALAIRERVLGPDHPDTAESLSNLGTLLQKMGELAAARPYLERALDIYERVLGSDHPATAQSLNNLGALLRAQGELATARPYLERGLAICEQSLGPTHKRTAYSLDSLGMLLKDIGELTTARPYFERALDICERILGPDHPDTALSLNNLGYLLHAQGELAAARPYFEHALAIREQSLGPSHSDTAHSLNNLGLLHQEMGDLDTARSYFEHALTIFKQSLGSHPETAECLNNLGTLLKEMGELAAAKPYLERALDICERMLGSDHPETARSLNNLGSLLHNMGDLAVARPYYERALDIYQRVLGPDHPNTTSTRRHLTALDPAQPPLQGDY